MPSDTQKVGSAAVAAAGVALYTHTPGAEWSPTEAGALVAGASAILSYAVLRMEEIIRHYLGKEEPNAKKRKTSKRTSVAAHARSVPKRRARSPNSN